MVCAFSAGTRLRSLSAYVAVPLFAASVFLRSAAAAECPPATPASAPGFIELVEKVKPAVVNISSSKMVPAENAPFRYFMPPDKDGQRNPNEPIPDRRTRQQSLGSGILISEAGFVVTSNHVIDEGTDIKIRLSDGREFTGTVVGRDRRTDLALIKISGEIHHLPTLQLADSDQVKVGEWVLAVGNPFGLEETVTQGIVSATGRVIGAGPYDDFIQSDAAINPGNSGGPLINLKGEVIGINTAMLQHGHGIGFATPSNLITRVVAQLQDKGRMAWGWIGVSPETVSPKLAQMCGLADAAGAVVDDVAPGSPAAGVGIRQGDVITAVGGKKIRCSQDLPKIVAAFPVGTSVDIDFVRNGRYQRVSVSIVELPGKPPRF